jgi:hypothetical protein
MEHIANIHHQANEILGNDDEENDEKIGHGFLQPQLYALNTQLASSPKPSLVPFLKPEASRLSPLASSVSAVASP